MRKTIVIQVEFFPKQENKHDFENKAIKKIKNKQYQIFNEEGMTE